MSEEKALTVVEQREVDFYGDDIIAILSEDNTVYVPIRPICDLLGVTWSPQRRRINRDPVLSKQFVTLTVTKDGPGNPNVLCLPLDFLNGWLFGINADRVNPDIRERLIRYQTECYRVLAEAFREGRLAIDTPFDDLLTVDTPAVQAYKMAQAILQIARNQVLLESRVGDVEHRLDALEAQMGNPERSITPAQTSAISQAVKAIGLKLGKRSGRNAFGGVYGELYRRFEIAGHRELSAAKYDEAMSFLRQWYGSLTGSDVPF